MHNFKRINIYVNFILTNCRKCVFISISLGAWQFGNISSIYARADTAPPLIKVNQIEFIGNTVFSDSELEKIIKPLPARPVSLYELYQLRSKITDFYLKKGYISSAAFISPQQFSRGIVKIRVIEGVLTNVEIKGLSKIKEGYIYQRLPLGKPVNQDSLFRAIALLNEDPLIKKLSAELVRLTPKNNALIVKVEEERSLKSQLNITNSYSPSIGTLGGTAKVQYHLLGYGDLLSLNYSLTRKDGLSRYGAGYSFPFNAKNGTISLSYSNADSKIVEEPIVSALDIQSGLSAYRLNLRQPIDLSVNSQLALEIGFDQIQSQSSVNGTSFAFTRGLPDGEVRLSALRLVQEYSTRDETNSFIARSQFSLGLDLFDATVSDTGIDGLFWSWQGQAQYQKKFAQTVLVSNLNVQLSDDRLLPIEQISLGGKNSVRGYRDNLSLGDNGLFGGIEVQIPVLISKKVILKLVPFFDAGTVWNNSSEEIIANTVFSTGLGLDLELNRLVRAKVDYAIPLTNTDLPSQFANQEVTFDFSFQL